MLAKLKSSIKLLVFVRKATSLIRCTLCCKDIVQGEYYTKNSVRNYCNGCRPFEPVENPLENSTLQSQATIIGEEKISNLEDYRLRMLGAEELMRLREEMEIMRENPPATPGNISAIRLPRMTHEQWSALNTAIMPRSRRIDEIDTKRLQGNI